MNRKKEKAKGKGSSAESALPGREEEFWLTRDRGNKWP
jgi:hypothetical protein